MSIKGKKLAVVILEYLLISVLISLFVFCFLYFLSGSIVENYFWHHGIVLTEVQKRVFSVWLRSVCGLAGLIIFVVLFLFMLGQRLSYLIQIIQGVELLKEKEMETRIPLEGDDELTRLAETINFVAASRRELDQRERQMQEEKEAWVRSMSHDIRTPLTSMVSYSELLLDKENPEPEELRDAVRLMHEKSLQIKELTDQLMSPSVSGHPLSFHRALRLFPRDSPGRLPPLKKQSPKESSPKGAQALPLLFSCQFYA